MSEYECDIILNKFNELREIEKLEIEYKHLYDKNMSPEKIKYVN